MITYYGVADAKESLRLDGSDNDAIVLRLLRAIPTYIEQATGLDAADQENEPMCAVVADFLVQLWYMPEQIDTLRYQRVIDSLLSSIRSNSRAST